MLNTLVYLWEYAYSHPRATNLGIRREYERIPKMSANPTPACSLLIAVRDAWQAAHRSAVPPRAVRPGSGVSLAAAPCCHAVEPGGDDPPPCAAPGFRAAVHTEAASGVQAGTRFSWVYSQCMNSTRVKKAARREAYVRVFRPRGLVGIREFPRLVSLCGNTWNTYSTSRVFAVIGASHESWALRVRDDDDGLELVFVVRSRRFGSGKSALRTERFFSTVVM